MNFATPAIFNPVIQTTGGESLGPELISNPDFGSEAGWTLDTGWSISGGQLHSTGVNGFAYYKNTGASQDGTLYRVVINVAEINAGGSLQISFGKAINGIINYADSVGSFSFDMICQSNDTHFYLRQYPTNAFIGKINSISIKEIL